MKPTFFATPAAFRRWLDKNHETSKELWVGFYKKDSGKASITWPESVDQALCFGWIDSKANKRDPESFYLQFTPRKSKSNWSKINIARVEKLVKEGLMTEHGQRAIEIAKESGKWELSLAA